jgi:protein gp37
MKRFGQDFNTVTRAKGFSKPLSWKESGRVFVCPHSDFFIEDADEWRGEAWEIMRRTPHLTYLILTKRPENIIYRLPVDWYGGGYNNVWLGVTAENQKMADRRIPILLQIPAAVRFVSVEPMIGEMSFRWGGWIDYSSRKVSNEYDALRTLDWVIVGGESGQNARKMQPEWAAEIKRQCKVAGVPFFMKQMSGRDKKTRHAIPDYLNVREFPNTGAVI